MKFLSSPNFSLACAAFNSYFAITSFMNGSWLWFGVCAVFAGVCLNNYRLSK